MEEGASGLHGPMDQSVSLLDALSFLRISAVKQQITNPIAPPVPRF
jgi:hypothetical protein